MKKYYEKKKNLPEIVNIFKSKIVNGKIINIFENSTINFKIIGTQFHKFLSILEILKLFDAFRKQFFS